MIQLTFWLQLLFLVLTLRQSAAASDQCSELREEISSLERDIVRKTELKHNYEILAGNCQEHLTKKILEWRDTATKLKKAEAVNSGLKKQLEAIEEALKSNNQTLVELQTANDGLAQTVKSLNQTVQRLCAQPQDACRVLLEAAKSGDVNTTKVLFKCVNDSCTDDGVNRNTPLVYAARYGHVAVVRVLLEEGANVERTNAYRATALHHAAANGHLEVCRLLLDWGAKVDALNDMNKTPLYYAAWWGHLSVLNELVERGANVSLKDNVGRTASDVARNWGKKDVADWLDSVSRG